jgi:predicted nucleic acid-binding protein
MMVYLDTSSLVKLYVDEIDSEKIRVIAYNTAAVSTSKVACAEARAAFARKQKEEEFSVKVLRKNRGGS